jgi:hypothetical protein
MSKTLVTQTMTECVKHGGNQGAKLHRAIKLQREMMVGQDFATLADAFAILASWNGHVVTVDGQTWTPPLLPDNENDSAMVAR